MGATVKDLRKYLRDFPNSTEVDVLSVTIEDGSITPIAEPLNLSFSKGNVQMGNDMGKLYLRIGVIIDKTIKQPVLEAPKSIKHLN